MLTATSALSMYVKSSQTDLCLLLTIQSTLHITVHIFDTQCSTLSGTEQTVGTPMFHVRLDHLHVAARGFKGSIAFL